MGGTTPSGGGKAGGKAGAPREILLRKGVRIVEMEEGRGPTVQDRKRVKVAYVGRLGNASGKVFESGGGWMAEVRWQRSPGFFFDLSKPFGPEEVRAAWHRVVDFNGAGAPEEDGTLGPHSPQLQQVMQGPTPSKL